MNNGTQNTGTSIEELKNDLDKIIEDLYCGLRKVAEKERGLGRSDTADALEELANDICNHWPTCRVNRPVCEQDSVT